MTGAAGSLSNVQRRTLNQYWDGVDKASHIAYVYIGSPGDVGGDKPRFSDVAWFLRCQ
jgi:hypothetical protein